MGAAFTAEARHWLKSDPPLLLPCKRAPFPNAPSIKPSPIEIQTDANDQLWSFVMLGPPMICCAHSVQDQIEYCVYSEGQKTVGETSRTEVLRWHKDSPPSQATVRIPAL